MERKNKNPRWDARTHRDFVATWEAAVVNGISGKLSGAFIESL